MTTLYTHFLTLRSHTHAHYNRFLLIYCFPYFRALPPYCRQKEHLRTVFVPFASALECVSISEETVS